MTDNNTGKDIDMKTGTPFYTSDTKCSAVPDMEKNFFQAFRLQQKYESIKIDVSFSCVKGSMTCIVGPSGSGKSTVLRLISGLDSGLKTLPGEDEKKIILDGTDITDLPPAKRGIGMVFQSHTLFDHLTVADNVAYGLVSRGMKKKEARKQAVEFLKLFGLEGFENRWPSTLSGGEGQRVSLARTLIMNPKLVLFDEPLSALDAPLRRKLASLIKDLQKQFNFTGIMVTHDINEARQLADQILLMKAGHIKWAGTSADFDESWLEQ